MTDYISVRLMFPGHENAAEPRKLSPADCADLVRAGLAEIQRQEQPKPIAPLHEWVDDRCVKCGDKDWMGGPCTPTQPQAVPVDEKILYAEIKRLSDELHDRPGLLVRTMDELKAEKARADKAESALKALLETQADSRIDGVKHELARANIEIERLTTSVDSFMSLRRLHAENGRIEVSVDLGKEIVEVLTGAFQVMLQKAENYVECDLSNAAGESYTFTIRKRTGKTPHELRREAEARADAMERAGAEQAKRADENYTALIAHRERADKAKAELAECMDTITDWIDTIEAGCQVTLAEMHAFRDAFLAKHKDTP